MTGEVATQFGISSRAVLLPATQRLRGGRESRVHTKVVKQAVRRQPLHVAAIPFHGFLKWSGQETHLSHGEGLHSSGHVAAREFKGRLKRRDLGRGSVTLFVGRLRRRGRGSSGLLCEQ